MPAATNGAWQTGASRSAHSVDTLGESVGMRAKPLCAHVLPCLKSSSWFSLEREASMLTERMYTFQQLDEQW